MKISSTFFKGIKNHESLKKQKNITQNNLNAPQRNIQYRLVVVV